MLLKILGWGFFEGGDAVKFRGLSVSQSVGGLCILTENESEVNSHFCKFFVSNNRQILRKVIFKYIYFFHMGSRMEFRQITWKIWEKFFFFRDILLHNVGDKFWKSIKIVYLLEITISYCWSSLLIVQTFKIFFGNSKINLAQI